MRFEHRQAARREIRPPPKAIKTDAGKEHRIYRWLFEGDTDEQGYDHNNEAACLWIYLRVGLDHGDFEAEEQGEWIDLHNFGLRFWPVGR